MSLGTGPKKGWWEPCASMRHSKGVSMATLSVGTSPSSSHQPALSHWRNFSGNTYLTQYLPGSDFQQGWKEQGSTKFASEAMQKNRCDGKAKAYG